MISYQFPFAGIIISYHFSISYHFPGRSEYYQMLSPSGVEPGLLWACNAKPTIPPPPSLCEMSPKTEHRSATKQMRNQIGFVFVVFQRLWRRVPRDNIYTFAPHIFGQVKHENRPQPETCSTDHTPEAPVREEKEVQHG